MRNGLRDRRLAAAKSFFLAAAAFGLAASAVPNQAYAGCSTQERITVPIGRRVSNDSTLLTRVDSYRCRSEVVAVGIAFIWISGRGGFRSQVTEITVDGRPVAQSQLAEINRVLGTFERSPDIVLECHSRQFRLSLTQSERGRPTKIESVPFTLEHR
jgi:hypothetical protein